MSSIDVPLKGGSFGTAKFGQTQRKDKWWLEPLLVFLGYAAFKSIGLNPAKGVVYPLIIAGFGIIASIISIYSVRGRKRDRTAMTAINRGYRIAGLATILSSYLVAQFYVKDLKVFWAVLVGVLLGQVASLITEQFTSTERSPVREIAESTRTNDPRRPGLRS